MAGLQHLLAGLLAGKSAGSGSETPYRTAAGQVWHSGALAGGHHVTGQRAGQVFTPGRVAGQIHG